MGDCFSSDSQQHSPYSRLQEGQQYHSVDNRNGGSRHLLSASSSGSSSADEHSSSLEQTSNKERELQKQLNAARRELDEERARIWTTEAELTLTLTDVEREVTEYKNQLLSLSTTLENEYREWEMVRGRLESQVERERLKVRARDVQIHELKLSKEQETAALSSQVLSLRHQLESSDIKHQLTTNRDTVHTQPVM